MANVVGGGGETKANVSGWTVDTIKYYFDAMLAEADMRYHQRFVAQENALTKAEVATAIHFKSINEFRQVLSDQTRTFITRAELDGIAKEIATLQRSISWAAGAGAIIAFLASMAAQVFTHR